MYCISVSWHTSVYAETVSSDLSFPRLVQLVCVIVREKYSPLFLNFHIVLMKNVSGVSC